MMPPTPMPRFTRAKLTPKYCWRSSPFTTVAMRALNPGHETPKFTPISTRATAATAGWVANASRVQPAIIDVSPMSRMMRAPKRSMSVPPGPVTIKPVMAMRLIRAPESPRSNPRTSCR
jgi:hypothetical protein